VNRRLINSIFLCLLVCAGCQDARKAEVETFNKANAAYKQGEYKGAIELYKKIIAHGLTSQQLQYNLGNAYMKDGQLGRAITAYERALRLQPRESDLKANLAFAKNRIESPEPQGPKSLFPHLQMITLDEIVMILAMIGVGITVLILVGLFSQWRFRKTAFFITVLGVVFAFHIFALLAKIDDLRDRAVVVATGEVRYEPEENATAHFTAYEGWKVRVLKESGGWIKVERPDGLQGWMPSDRLEKI
jgi:tetratricopeptide (TPR) repeat protein